MCVNQEAVAATKRPSVAEIEDEVRYFEQLVKKGKLRAQKRKLEDAVEELEEKLRLARGEFHDLKDCLHAYTTEIGVGLPEEERKIYTHFINTRVRELAAAIPAHETRIADLEKALEKAQEKVNGFQV